MEGKHLKVISTVHIYRSASQHVLLQQILAIVADEPSFRALGLAMRPRGRSVPRLNEAPCTRRVPCSASPVFPPSGRASAAVSRRSLSSLNRRDS